MTEIHKYEIDRRYPFEATVDSGRRPVPVATNVWVWLSDGSGYEGCAECFFWGNKHSKEITHFMVLEYRPEKHTAWVNVYPIGVWESFSTKGKAET